MGQKIRQPDSQLPTVGGEVVSSYGYVRRQKWTAPDAAANDAVHAAITLLTTVQDITAAITNPDFPRIVTITGTKAGGSLTGNVVITGTNIRGEVITDTIAINTNDSTVSGVKAFKTVTNIHLPVRATSGDTVKVGTSEALGLDRCMSGNEVLVVTVDGVKETTAPTVTFDTDEVEKNTMLPDTGENASGNYAVVYVATEVTSKRHTTA